MPPAPVPGPRTSAQAAGAPLPTDEVARLQSLTRYEVLDTPSEAEYDALTALAADLCDTPMAAVSVLDVDRQWFKSSVGLDVPETPRSASFCAWAVLDPHQVMVVPDATADPRFAGDAAVTGALGVRFYAGAPLLMSDGQPLGALCVIDTRPRTLTDRQLTALRTLADQVVAHLELRRSLLEGEELRHRLSQWEAVVESSAGGRRRLG